MSMALPTPVDPRHGTIRVEIRDPGFSVEAVFVDSDPVALRDQPNSSCAGSVVAGSVPGTEAASLACPAD